MTLGITELQQSANRFNPRIVSNLIFKVFDMFAVKPISRRWYHIKLDYNVVQR